MEIQINSLHKSIEAEVADIQELQQHWLKDQSELVMLTKETEQQSNDVDQMKKKITILSQKKLRIEGQCIRRAGVFFLYVWVFWGFFLTCLVKNVPALC